MIDMHVHLNPHSASTTHIVDVEDYLVLANAAEMRGEPVKDVAFSTTGITYLANKHSSGAELFGLLALNLAMGGA